MVFAMTRDQLMILLLILMAVVLAAELIYIVAKKKRRKKEMGLFRKEAEPPEPLADRAYNTILTTENIASSLARQGIFTGEADSLIAQAKAQHAARDFTGAIERAEAAKLVLLRLRRESGSRPSAESSDPGRRPMDENIYERPKREEKSLDTLPANYVQAKFMLSTTKDTLERKAVRSGEAFDFYSMALRAFEQEDYTKSLSFSIKAEKLLDSGTLTLIGEEKTPPVEGEVEEAWACPNCESEISGDDVFCRKCGQSLAAKECPGCGIEIEPADTFCRKCGRKLK